MARYGRVGFCYGTFARLTGLLLSVEPLADEVRVDSCYDGKDKADHYVQSSHLLSEMSD